MTFRSRRSAATVPCPPSVNFAERIGQPSRGRVGGGLDDDVDVVFAAKPAGDDVELQLADDADDRLAAAGRGVEHLHQPFFLELLQAFVELLVARVLQPHAAEVLRRKSRHALELQRLPGMHRVADGELARD